MTLNTPISTKEGWKTIDELNIGDYIFDKNGLLTKITHTFNISHNPCYKIYFDNNDEIIVGSDNNLPISFKGIRKISEKIMTGDDLFNYTEKLKNLKKKHAYHIPKIYNPKPLMMNETPLIIDPYVLGVWLGDGHSACGMITNMYDEVWGEIKKRGYEIGNDVSGGGCGKAESKTVFGLITKLRELNILHNKDIPDVYLRSSYKQRLDILRGFMDADGYYNDTRNRYVMATTNENQADYFVKLLATMGIKPTKLKCNKYCNDKILDGYDVCFTTNVYPFMARTLKIKEIIKDNNSFRNIMKIEKIEPTQTKQIVVDSDTHTFLVGETLIVMCDNYSDHAIIRY